MKKLLVLLTGLLLVSSLGMAQADSDENSFGVYFDTDAYITATTTAAPFAPVTAYLCVVNPTSNGVSGWECELQVTGADVARSYSYAGGGLNVFDAVATGLFNVGVGTGALQLLPVNNVVVLATYSAFIMAPTDEVLFTIMPFPGSVTFNDVPGYVDGDDVGTVVPCGTSTGFPYGAPCATINSAYVVIPNEDTTWSGVKTLYQ